MNAEIPCGEIRMFALKDIPLVITGDMIWKPPVSAGSEFFITPKEARVLVKRGLADFVKK